MGRGLPARLLRPARQRGTPTGDVSRISFAGGLEDLDGLRVALGFDKITVVGHSAGAHLAGLYAGTHPESTSAVVLLNSGPPLAPEARWASRRSRRRTSRLVRSG